MNTVEAMQYLQTYKPYWETPEFYGTLGTILLIIFFIIEIRKKRKDK